MNLLQARDIVKAAARNAGSSGMYTNAQIDVAIMAVCARDAHVLRYPKLNTTITVQSGSNALDLSALTALGFGAHHFISADIAPTGTNTAGYSANGGSLARIDFDDYWKRKNYFDRDAQPVTIAFEDNTTAWVWPTPDAAYTGVLRWFQPFTSWTAGTPDATAATTTLSLPDDWLNQILVTGVVARLMRGVPEHAKLAESLDADHERVIRDLRDAASLGGRLLDRGYMGQSKGYSPDFVEGGRE